MNFCDDLWYDILTCDASLDNASFLKDMITSPLGKQRNFYALIKNTLIRKSDRLGVWVLSYFLKDLPPCPPDTLQTHWDKAIKTDDLEMARAISILVPEKIRRGILLVWTVRFELIWQYWAVKLLDVIMSFGHKVMWIPEKHFERIFEDKEMLAVLTKHIAPAKHELFKMLEKGYHWTGRTGHVSIEDYEKLKRIFRSPLPTTETTLGDVVFIYKTLNLVPQWFKVEYEYWYRSIVRGNPSVYRMLDVRLIDLE